MIKSRMQTDGFSPADGQKYTSTLDCVRKVWKAEGAGAFVRGLGPTLIRSVHVFHHHATCTKIRPRSPFANGATFLGFEMAQRFIHKILHEEPPAAF